MSLMVEEVTSSQPETVCQRPTNERTTRRPYRLHYATVDLSKLSTSEYDALFGEMGSVMHGATSGGSGSTEWAIEDWRDRKSELRRGSEVFLIRDSCELVGFVTFRVRRVHRRVCLHLSSGYILPTYQGCGIGYLANARIIFHVIVRHPFSSYLMAADILNPVVMAGWRARIPWPEVMYPPVTPGLKPTALRDIAAELADSAYSASEFNPGTGVLRGKTRPRGSEFTRSGDCAVDGYFEQHVDPTRGDTVLMILDGSRAALLRGVAEILRAVPRSLRRSLKPRRRPRVGE